MMILTTRGGCARRLRGGEDDRVASTRVLSKSIDASRYVVYTSAKRNHITVRWRERARAEGAQESLQGSRKETKR